ncbi:MAG: bifunctional hydroxymethylpyrimidine kinase/phosphomethylpyrimidine kinase [Herpetosiphon sp.]
MFKALTIAGSDSGGGAGIQGDLKTFMAHGVYGTSAVTAITAQNTLGVQAVEFLSPGLVAAQMTSVLADIGADAVKTGMLGTAEIIEAVSVLLQRFRIERLVIDPVMLSTSGAGLLVPEAVDVLRERLLPLAMVVTPNLREAGVLLDTLVVNEDDMRDAARAIFAMGSRVVVIKGGHLVEDAVDIVFDGQRMWELRTPRINTPHGHGTGCAFAAATAAVLARGAPVATAIEHAKAFVNGALRSAVQLGTGAWPVNHLFAGCKPVD